MHIVLASIYLFAIVNIKLHFPLSETKFGLYLSFVFVSYFKRLCMVNLSHYCGKYQGVSSKLEMVAQYLRLNEYFNFRINFQGYATSDVGP